MWCPAPNPPSRTSGSPPRPSSSYQSVTSPRSASAPSRRKRRQSKAGSRLSIWITSKIVPSESRHAGYRRAAAAYGTANRPPVTAGTLRQHAVAAEAIARGDLLFALYSGDLPPAEDEQLWLLPDGNEPEAVAATLAARGGRDRGARARRALPRERARRLPARRRRARPHRRHARLVGRPPQRAAGGGRAVARRRRARLGRPEGPPPGTAPAALPADDDLLPALTDSAFALLVARLERRCAAARRAHRRHDRTDRDRAPRDPDDARRAAAGRAAGRRPGARRALARAMVRSPEERAAARLHRDAAVRRAAARDHRRSARHRGDRARAARRQERRWTASPAIARRR